MPKVVPFMPSNDSEKVKADVVKLLEAAAAVGVALEPQAFVQSWLQDSTRVVVAYEADKPTGFGIMASGRRYFDDKNSASVLIAEGPDRKAVLEFMRDMAKVLGAHIMFYEGDELGGEPGRMRMVQVN